MLNEILSEYDKVREKDFSTKNSIKDIIKSIKTDLNYLQSEIEDISNQMEVIKTKPG
jgi:Txe/YoeB family toxin of Txe-Axe toxin-antitoxin module